MSRQVSSIFGSLNLSVILSGGSAPRTRIGVKLRGRKTGGDVGWCKEIKGK